MILLEIHRQASFRTRIRARMHANRILLVAGIVSVLFTVAFYFDAGLIQSSPLYHGIPMEIGVPLVWIQSFNAVAITQLLIMYFRSLGEVTAPKVIESYWQLSSKLILRERIKKDMANGIWKYIILHRKHDPLYKSEIDELNEKLEANKIEVNDKLEVFMRELRIKNLAINKLTNLKIQAERERDLAIQQQEKSTRLTHRLLNTIFKLEEIIKKLRGR